MFGQMGDSGGGGLGLLSQSLCLLLYLLRMHYRLHGGTGLHATPQFRTPPSPPCRKTAASPPSWMIDLSRDFWEGEPPCLRLFVVHLLQAAVPVRTRRTSAKSSSASSQTQRFREPSRKRPARAMLSHTPCIHPLAVFYKRGRGGPNNPTCVLLVKGVHAGEVDGESLKGC